MLIALLAVLGVDLIVVVVLLGPYHEPGATVAAGQPPLVLHP
jgi:hypothetical protein